MNRRNFISGLFSIPLGIVAKKLLPVTGKVYSKQDTWPVKDTPCTIKVSPSVYGETVPVVFGESRIPLLPPGMNYFVNPLFTASFAWWLPNPIAGSYTSALKKYQWRRG